MCRKCRKCGKNVTIDDRWATHQFDLCEKCWKGKPQTGKKED